MKKSSFSINVLMYIFINILLLVLINDYITFFINGNYIIQLLLSLGILGCLNFLIRKKINITSDFHKSDIIFFVLLLIVFIITIVYPDRSFDTINYHLYLQENPFGKKIGFDFFAGKNLNSYSYAFPDRIFYMFRYFLGYRLGVIFNYLVIAVIYYQVKEILKKLLPNVNVLAISIIATLCATSLSLIDIVDSYYIDLISVVLLLEIFKLAVFSKLNEKENNFVLFGYLGLLFGFSFAAKISNAFLLILFFLVYVFRNKNIVKCINLKNILIAFLGLFIPFILYAIYTYMETGNPVFPFYNTIFHSKYFADRIWLDTRFGPHGIKETLIWPILILFVPKRACDISIMEPIWTSGYIVSIGYTLYYLYNKFIKKIKIDNSRLIFFTTVVVSYLLWSKFQLGYSRYGLVVLVIGSIATYIFIYDIIKNKKYFLLSIALPFMLFNYFYTGSNYLYQEQNWIYNNYYNDISENYKYNLSNIFAKGNDNKLEFEDGSVWGIFYFNSGFAQMINNKIPIINVTNSADNEYTKDLLNEKLNNASHIYTLVDSLDMYNFIDYINTTKYKIVDVKKVMSSNVLGFKSQFIYIFEVKNIAGEENNVDLFQDKEYDVTDKNSISMFLGIAKDLNTAYSKDLPLTIIGYKNGIEEVIDNIKVPSDGNMIKLKYNVSKYDKVALKSFDDNHKVDLNNWFMNVNLEIR